MRKKKTDITILTGFLGAGKTTLLKRILSGAADLSRTVVIVNEFGDVGIDGLLLKETDSDVVELAGGCVCCAMKTDLMTTLKRIQKEFAPRRIFIEASGVADPASIVEVLGYPDFRVSMAVRRVITVLEPDFWESRDNFGTFFMGQLREADLILLNKIDEIPPEKVPGLLGEIHEAVPDCRVVPTTYCNVDPDTLLPQPFTGDSKDLERHDRQVQSNDAHDSDAEQAGFTAFSFQTSGPMDEGCFIQFMNNLPWELFRVKGLVCFADRTVMLNHVGGKSEWSEWGGPPETRVALVGLRVNPGQIIEKLKRCQLTAEN